MKKHVKINKRLLKDWIYQTTENLRLNLNFLIEENIIQAEEDLKDKLKKAKLI